MASWSDKRRKRSPRAISTCGRIAASLGSWLTLTAGHEAWNTSMRWVAPRLSSRTPSLWRHTPSRTSGCCSSQATTGIRVAWERDLGQLGKHFMSKMFPHVDGYVPDTVFNRHAGPAAQAVVIDDFLDASFDCGAHGFLGGATLGAENQFLPIQISRETLPPDVERWGKRDTRSTCAIGSIGACACSRRHSRTKAIISTSIRIIATAADSACR